MKAQVRSQPELSSPEALERFRKAAKTFTLRAVKSQASARKVLIDEGIYTSRGSSPSGIAKLSCLHRLSSSFILGYHGCDLNVGERLLAGAAFRLSNNDYDWLGPGIYFWEANPQRALEFAHEASKRKAPSIAKPFAIGAVIELAFAST